MSEVEIKVGHWVWHKDTGAGPWLVLKVDNEKWLVYVDSKPDRPSVKPHSIHGDKKSLFYVTLDHADVKHHYMKMLTTEKPKPKPPKVPWHKSVDWERLGQGFGTAMWAGGLIFLTAVYVWIEWSAK